MAIGGSLWLGGFPVSQDSAFRFSRATPNTKERGEGERVGEALILDAAFSANFFRRLRLPSMLREEQVAVDLATERIIHPLYISHFFTFPAMIQPTTPLANATMSHEVNRFILSPSMQN